MFPAIHDQPTVPTVLRVLPPKHRLTIATAPTLRYDRKPVRQALKTAAGGNKTLTMSWPEDHVS